MPLDFPSNPTNGQTYNGYVYNSSIPGWQAKPAAQSPFYTGAVAPSNPATGDSWWNTNDGTMYVYYNDGNSSQWVESRSAITSDGYYSPNAIINSAFDVWQRGTSFSSAGYTADRWTILADGTGATRAITQQAFTPGAAPVSGYESQFFFRYNQSVAGTGATFNIVEQRVEDVRTFAGQTVTVSFWAKAAAATTVTAQVQQNFGTGGSTEVQAIATQTYSLTTSWQRYTYSAQMPSISGKTIGTNSYVAVRFNMPNNATFTFDLWGVQFELGAVATPFRRNANSLQGELAACKRYYFEWTGGQYISRGPVGGCSTVNTFLVGIPISMRIVPALGSRTANVGVWNPSGPGVVGGGTTSINGLYSTADNVYVQYVHGTNVFTAGTIGMLNTTNAGGWIIAFDAEL